MRVLLVGGYFGRRITRSLVGIAAGIFCWFCLSTLRGNPVFDSGAERFIAVLTAYVAGIAAAAVIYPMIGRARYCWSRHYRRCGSSGCC